MRLGSGSSRRDAPGVRSGRRSTRRGRRSPATSRTTTTGPTRAPAISPRISSGFRARTPARPVPLRASARSPRRRSSHLEVSVERASPEARTLELGWSGSPSCASREATSTPSTTTGPGRTGAWTFDRRIRLPLRKEWLARESDGETSWAGSFMNTSAAQHDSYQSFGARQGDGSPVRRRDILGGLIHQYDRAAA